MTNTQQEGIIKNDWITITKWYIKIILIFLPCYVINNEGDRNIIKFKRFRGVTYMIGIEDMIPTHPMCRCAIVKNNEK